MSMPSVDDSDVEEALSPPANDEEEEIIELNGNDNSLTTRLAEHGEDLEVELTLSTRQSTRRSHKKTKTFASKSILDNLGIDNTALENGWPQETRRNENTALEESDRDTSDNSILSRDGDVVTYSNISMSSPRFAKSEEMPPPRSTRRSQSSRGVTATQSMSDWGDNPLEILIQPQTSDDLPSTKPSSDAGATNPLSRSIGTQDDLEAAFQLADDLVRVPNPKESEDGRATTEGHGEDSMDELALPNERFPKAHVPINLARPSRKRKLETSEDEASGLHKASENTGGQSFSGEDLFAGLPTEHYRPRKSRLRGSTIDDELFAKIDFSKVPEAVLRKKRRLKQRTAKENLENDSANGGEDVPDIEERGHSAPNESRSRRDKTIKHEAPAEKETKLKSGVSQSQVHSTQPEGVIVVRTNESTEESIPQETSEPDLYTKHKKSKKKGDPKQGKKVKAGSRSSQSADVVHDGELSVLEGADTAEETREKHATQSAEPDQTRTTDEVPACQSREEGQALLPQPSKPQSGKRLKTSPADPEVDVERDIDAVACNISPSKDPTTTTIGHSVNQTGCAASTSIITSIPLSDVTNTTLSAEQSDIKNSTKSSLNMNRMTYRVGLSKRSRIEPLLTIVRKDKDAPKIPPRNSKKKGASQARTDG